MHVSVLSLASCAGRLLSGTGSDLLANKLNMSRMWCLFMSAFAFTGAQFSSLQTENPHHLVVVSALTGIGYGILYGFFPSLLTQKFGIKGMSQNWGTIILAPVISGNMFNIIYGVVYDKHSVILPDGERECMDGLPCYWVASLVTLLAGVVGMALSVGSIWRENRQHYKERRSDHDRDVQVS